MAANDNIKKGETMGSLFEFGKQTARAARKLATSLLKNIG